MNYWIKNLTDTELVLEVSGSEELLVLPSLREVLVPRAFAVLSGTQTMIRAKILAIRRCLPSRFDRDPVF